MSLQPTDHDPLSSTPERDRLIDHRTRPRGVLPRHLQTWIMAGLAAAMLFIIVVTGRPSPAPRKTPDAAAPQTSAALPPDRLRRYQEQLAEQELRLRQEIAATQAAAAAAAAQTTPLPADAPPPTDPIADEQRRRAYSSLFAENVAFTRRAGVTPVPPRPSNPAPAGGRATPSADDVPLGYPPPPPAPMPTTSMPGASTPTTATPATSADGPQTPPVSKDPPRPCGLPSLGATRCLLEGTIIDAVLTNRLDGSMASPVNALVTWPIYTADGQQIVIPAGARVLGTAAPVQAFGESRLAVKFRRLIMPNGQTHSLDQFTGLNQRGDAGLKGQVNRHYLQLFGASLAIGSLSGLAQFSTRSGASGPYSFSDAYGQGLGGSLAASAGRILDRFLNVLPTVTIREGHRIKIYLTSDLALPPYPEETRR